MNETTPYLDRCQVARELLVKAGRELDAMRRAAICNDTRKMKEHKVEAGLGISEAHHVYTIGKRWSGRERAAEKKRLEAKVEQEYPDTSIEGMRKKRLQLYKGQPKRHP